MQRDHWMPLDITRWRTSSAWLLPLHARGLYLELLAIAWQRGGSLPRDERSLARLAGAERAEFRRAWVLVKRYWRESSDGQTIENDTLNEMLEGRAEQRARRVAASRAGNNARWGVRSDSDSDSDAVPESHSDAQRHPNGIAFREEKRRGYKEEEQPAASPPSSRTHQTAEQPNSRKAKQPAHPNRQAVIDAFAAAYRQATGSDPTWGGKERGIADRLAGQLELDDLRRRLDRCYRGRHPRWIWRDGAVPDIATFARVLDQLAEARAKNAEDPLPIWRPDR